MLIDINANIGHWAFQQMKYNSCSLLLERMDDFGTDISVISNISGIFYKDTQAANEEMHEELRSRRRFRDRFIPFAIINPMYGAWKHDLDVCINKMGIRGIRMHPIYHDYDLLHSNSIELVKTARDKNLVVAFTMRMVDSRGPRHWMDVKTEWRLSDVMPIIQKVPDAKYFILNAAQSINLNDEELKLFKEAQALIDTSGRRLLNPGELIKTFGADRFAFGTHSPILDYVTGLLRIEALRESEADDSTKEQLRSGNAKRLLGI